MDFRSVICYNFCGWCGSGVVKKLAHDDGLTVIISMHDLNMAALYADRLALLHDGAVIAISPPAEETSAELRSQTDSRATNIK